MESNILNQEKFTKREKFLDQLYAYTIVDMGIITNASFTDFGYRATVRCPRIEHGQQISYENVEVILPGNEGGGITYDLDNCSCIVFGPLSSFVSVDDHRILGPNEPYGQQYLKCMPVNNPAIWEGKGSFDAMGNFSYDTSTSLFQLGIDGSFSFYQKELDQRMSYTSDGGYVISSPSYYYLRQASGAYYRYVRGSEPGSISFFESFKDNIKDTFWTSLEAFEIADSNKTEWDQLLEFMKWRRHASHDTSTDICYIEYYDSSNKLLSREDINPDGSNLLVNTNPSGNNLFSREIKSDGTLTLIVGQDKYKLEIKPDGTVTETQTSDKGITSNTAILIESTGTSLITIKNSIASLGEIFSELCDGLTALHTEGGPAAHTATAWAAEKVAPLKIKAGQVLG
jgi:hypothetical protein